MKKPYTDPNPQLGPAGIARRFAASEERKPPGAGATPVDQGDTVEARRVAPMTGSRPVGATPTVHDAAGKPVRSTGRGRDVPVDIDRIKAVTAEVNEFADKLAADKAERKAKRKGHGHVVLPAPPALGKSTITAGAVKVLKKAKAKKRGRPATSKQPWLEAGVSRATYFRRQGRKSG